jgi:TolA-binding protein
MKVWGVFIGVGISVSFLCSAQNISERVNVQKRSFVRQPSIRNLESYQTEKAKLLAKRRQSLILDIKQALKAIKDKEQQDEFQHRLANLYLEEYKYQTANGIRSKEFIQKAYGIFKELSSRSGQSPRADEITFQLGQLALELGQTAKAQEAFLTLVQKHPSSPFVDESTLQIADYAFEQSDFTTAIKHFSSLASKPDSSLFLYAHYKLAWAYYNLGKINLTLQHFLIVINEETAVTQSGHSIALKKESVRDVCLPFADLKKYQEGYAFYLGQDENYTRSGIECLASLAQERGDWRPAIDLNNKLLNMEPHFIKNPDYSLALIEIYRGRDKREEVHQTLSGALTNYFGDSTWREIFSSDIKVFNSFKTTFEEVTRKLTLETHSVGQKTKNLTIYTHARNLYHLYLTHFSQSPEAPKMQFYLAEILFKQKDYANASESYFGVYQNPSSTPELKKESLFNALLSNSALVNEERKKRGQTEVNSKTHSKRTAASDDSFIEYSESELSFIRQAEEFSGVYKKDEKAPDLLFQVAYLKYLHHDNEKANQDFWILISIYPSHPKSKHAGLLILDIYHQQEDFPQMVASSKRLLQNSSLQEKEYKAQVTDILRKSELKLISALEGQEKYKEIINNPSYCNSFFDIYSQLLL